VHSAFKAQQHVDAERVWFFHVEIVEIDLRARIADRLRTSDAPPPYEVVASNGTGTRTTSASDSRCGGPKTPEPGWRERWEQTIKRYGADVYITALR
jgi:hypothetical protein